MAKEQMKTNAADMRAYWEEPVEYTAPLLGPDRDRSILVSVNGETIRLMRGVRVNIKRKFVHALENAGRQEMAAYNAKLSAQRAGSRAIANL